MLLNTPPSYFSSVCQSLRREKALLAFGLLRQKVQADPLELDDGRQVAFTISIGVASEYENSLDEMVNQADMMLYNAKNAGRNRVMSEE